jgi:hypothetical protein
MAAQTSLKLDASVGVFCAAVQLVSIPAALAF